MYCPKCKSRLYPIDEEYMKKYGKCSYCVTYGSKEKEESNGAHKKDVV